ncbi:uncharacterized protein LOC141898427 [Tubulanus polymorphus]|uniref:uncharacterized protein LOC141898427 n=1 Tax=Tubulanus polymorphus TaxID=672921 RepID=UPI003DA603D3
MSMDKAEMVDNANDRNETSSLTPERRNTELEMSYGSLVTSSLPTTFQAESYAPRRDEEHNFGGSNFLDSINASFKHKLDGQSVNLVKKYETKYGRRRTAAILGLSSPVLLPLAILAIMTLPCWMTNKMRVLSIWLWVLAIATIPPSILFFCVYTREYSVSLHTGDMVPVEVVNKFNDISCKGVNLNSPDMVKLYVYHRLPNILDNYTEPFNDVGKREISSPPFSYLKKFYLLQGTSFELVLNATKYKQTGKSYNVSHVDIHVIKGQENYDKWQRNPAGNNTFVNVNTFLLEGKSAYIFKAKTKASDNYYVVVQSLGNSNVSRVDFGTGFYMNRTIYNLPKGRLLKYPEYILGDIALDFPYTDPRVVVILDGRYMGKNDEETTVTFTCIPRLTAYLSVFVLFPCLMAFLASLWICWACKDEPIQIMRGDSYEKV